MLINVVMPIIVGILTIMSRINFVLCRVEHGNVYNLGALHHTGNFFMQVRAFERYIPVMNVSSVCIRLGVS